MKRTPLIASFLALTLVAGSALTVGPAAAVAGGLILAQAADDNGSQDDAIAKFLAARRAPVDMPTDRLEKRLQRAKVLLGRADVTPEQRTQLESLIAGMERELASRQAGQPQQAETPPETPTENQTAAPDAGTQQQGAPAPQTQMAQAPNAQIEALLNDTTPLGQLSPKELRNRFRTAMQLSRSNGISDEVRRKLRDIARTARAELEGRTSKQTTAGGTATPPAQPAEQSAGSVTAAQTGTQPPATGTADAEVKARAILSDNVRPEKLSDAELRKRLQDMRDLLAGNQVSRDTNRALRQKLAAERRILRLRVTGLQDVGSQQPGTGQPGAGQAGTGQQTGTGQVPGSTPKPGAGSNINVTVILGDRRPSEQLGDEDLRRRIDVYRDAVLDARYAEAERAYWRQVMERDRRILRQRLLDQRRLRQQRLEANKLDIDIDLNIRPSRRPPPSVFAAEADEDYLEEVLVAPPRREVQRRYTVDEIERSPDLRDAVTRIEIDTVHFGFGESFLREEEVENLDRIAEIMEKILAAHPGEVFMIEGHTDAVGSDAANQRLSLERAKAVREALTTYYVIPPENLKTVGLGERFLKIPTPDPEPENRRVSIARITPLVGALDE